MTNCFKCSGEILKYNFNGIEFEICKSCNAVVISKENFEKLCNNFNADCKTVDLFNSPSVKVKEEARKCVHCSALMEKVLYNGILIDRCKKCQLLAFDNGELSKYFALFSETPIEIMNNAKFIKTYCVQQEEISFDVNVKEPEKKTSINPEFKIQAKEREFNANPADGWAILGLFFVLLVISGIMFVTPITAIIGFILGGLTLFLCKGFKIVAPQEALVLTLFGKYRGTIRNAGFYWINPFCSTYDGVSWGSISLKTRTLENPKLKINDNLGNPIEIGIMVTWEIKDTAKAVFNVEHYQSFLSAQCDSALRNIARQYPYDSPEGSDVESLRNDSAEISEQLKNEIQNVVSAAGIRIINARITHLAYSTEIAAAMLQRQQANAVVEAKKAIVDGAVGIVEMALDKLERNKNIELDAKTKANMVNNLLVVLCGNKDSIPVIRNDVV